MARLVPIFPLLRGTLPPKYKRLSWLSARFPLNCHDTLGFVLDFVEFIVVASLKRETARFATHDVFVSHPKRRAGRTVRELVAIQ